MLDNGIKKSRLVSAFSFNYKDGYSLKVGFVVSGYRKRGDLAIVNKHEEISRTAKLAPYTQSLFDSCFKNW